MWYFLFSKWDGFRDKYRYFCKISDNGGLNLYLYKKSSDIANLAGSALFLTQVKTIYAFIIYFLGIVHDYFP